jgi:hypothetical protein
MGLVGVTARAAQDGGVNGGSGEEQERLVDDPRAPQCCFT